MTPREALDIFKMFTEDMSLRLRDRGTQETDLARAAREHAAEAVTVLEKLVRKDEADKRDVQARAMLGLTRQCTCGTTTPCTVWGHS